MNPAHLHLVLNHIPVLGTIFGVLLFTFGLVRDQELLVRVGLIVFVVAGLSAGAAYLTGEGAEVVAEQWGLSQPDLASHENAGFYALILAGVLGLFALGSLFLFRVRLPRSYAVIVLILALSVSGIMAWTATLGARIRHPELQSGTVTQEVTPALVPRTEDD